jgi:hypothetical protein
VCFSRADAELDSAHLFSKVLGAVAELERSLIVERVKAGLRNARAKGKRLGRPRSFVDAHKIARLRSQGVPWRKIARQMGNIGWDGATGGEKSRLTFAPRHYSIFRSSSTVAETDVCGGLAVSITNAYPYSKPLAAKGQINTSKQIAGNVPLSRLPKDARPALTQLHLAGSRPGFLNKKPKNCL